MTTNTLRLRLLLPLLPAAKIWTSALWQILKFIILLSIGLLLTTHLQGDCQKEFKTQHELGCKMPASTLAWQ